MLDVDAAEMDVAVASECFRAEGVIIVRGVLPANLAAALAEVTEQVRERQERTPGMLREQSLLDACPHSDLLVEFLNNSPLNVVAEAVIGHDDVFNGGLAALLGAREQDEALRWHRDFDEGHREFDALLKDPGSSVQFNVPLFDDDALWVVPGTHVRRCNAGERRHRERWDGIAPVFQRAVVNSSDANELLARMPGAVQVRLSRGDAALYSPQTLHAALYRGGVLRTTLHGAFKDARLARSVRALRFGLDADTFTGPAWDGDVGPFLTAQVAAWRQLREDLGRGEDGVTDRRVVEGGP